MMTQANARKNEDSSLYMYRFVITIHLMTEVIWLGHAAFIVKTQSISILIDPFLSNPVVGLMSSVYSLGTFKYYR